MFEDTDTAFYLDWQGWRRHFISQQEDDESPLTFLEARQARTSLGEELRFNHLHPAKWEKELMKIRGKKEQSLAILRWHLAFPLKW
ncbi:MAG: hypothetical protein ACYTEQ_30430 [Planctomycetota bacterium]|jgi:hypothetical protein